jgi:hypothetical protein
MTHEPPAEAGEPDRERLSSQRDGSASPEDRVLRVMGAPVGTRLAMEGHGFVKRHNLWLAQLRTRDRMAQGASLLVLLAVALVAFASGTTAGMLVFIACVLLVCSILVACSRWGQRVRRGRRRRR